MRTFSPVVASVDFTDQINLLASISLCKIKLPFHYVIFGSIQEGSYSSRGSRVGKQLIQNQHSQLQEVVYVLRRIETQVNAHQENILQSLDDHQLSLQHLFQKVFLSLSSIYQNTQSNEAFHGIMLKLLRLLFTEVSSALGSVQYGVEDLMRNLAENMCRPMVEYVKGLKEDIRIGKLKTLVAVVEEMEGIVRDGRLELEETKQMLKEEQQRKLEARRLKEAEEKKGAMEFIGFLLQAKKGSNGSAASRKVLAMAEDQVEDEKLLWSLLKENKVKVQGQASPFGCKDLLHLDPNNLYQHTKGISKSSAKIGPMVYHRPVNRSSSRLLRPSTTGRDSWPQLGSSPTLANAKGTLHKQLSPMAPLPKSTLRR